MCTNGIVGSKNVPACVWGYAVKRPGIFYTFYVTLCAISGGFGSTMVSSFVNSVIRLVQVLCKIVCTSGIVGSKNVPACVLGYAVRRPGILYTILGPQWCQVSLIW